MLRRRAQLLRTIIAVAVALAMAGCSMPRLLYQQADWLLLREMDDFLDLRDGQREQVALALETNLSRHRAEQLPGFAKAFGETAARARRGLAEQDVRWALDHGRILLVASIELLLPTVASTLADLTLEQRRHFAQRLVERADEFANSHAVAATSEEQLRRTTQRTVEFVERWTGPLSAEQIGIIDEANRAMPEIATQWNVYTRDRQQALMALLDSGAAAPAIDAFLRGWWLYRDALPPQLMRKRDQRIEARIRLIARLDDSLDSVQREHLVNRLQGLADDARELLRAA